MKKIEVITRPEKLEEVQQILNELGHDGMTVSMVTGCGLQKGHKEIYRGAPVEINLLPKIKIETVVHDNLVEEIVAQILERVRTSEVGDGKIFIYDVFNAIRIRTGERGTAAI
ncbi:MAG: P-II family nitrogen regulator [Clostridia bacterium]